MSTNRTAEQITADARALEKALRDLASITTEALEDLTNGRRVRGVFYGNLTVKAAAEVDRHANLLERSLLNAAGVLSDEGVMAAYTADGRGW